MKKSLILLFSLFNFLTVSLTAQEIISYTGNNNYTLVERTNLRRYDNGKYTGLLSREIRSFLTQKNTKGGSIRYDGDFYVEQDTVKNSQIQFTGIHDALASSFFIDETGIVTMEEDNGYPSFRSFPSFPKTEIRPGDSWEGHSIRTVDPLNTGIFTKTRMTIRYTYVRREVYKGEEVFRLTAQWATRYGISDIDYDGDPNLKTAMGSHNANILVNCQTGAMTFMTDNVDETFVYKDGNQVQYKGVILLFTEYPPSVNHEEILPELQRIGAIALADTNNVVTKEIYEDLPVNTSTWIGKNNAKSNNASQPKVPVNLGDKKITVQKTDAGIKLAIHDLKFKPDSAELMPGEAERLDEIASVLKKSGTGKFLIEGHTADTGYAEGEMKVSKERAYSIAQELSKRGIDAGRFICKGLGATNPIADNLTNEGKAMNRRVEITILERNK